MKRFAIAALTIGLACAACGHSDEEMAAKQREIDACKAEMKRELALAAQNAQAQHEADDKKYNDELATNQRLQKQLDDLQGQLSGAQSGQQSAEEQVKRLQQAMAEYQQRLKQLDDMRARFQDLKRRLAQIVAAGLNVTVRNNRMVIQLPGSILFPSGSDQLKPEGKVILKKVADIIHGDPGLNARTFQVAGHTDNVEYGNGPFGDNWGLSLARAKTVVLFLISPDTPPRYHPPQPANVPWGGNLDPHKWSAAGYGIWDPAAGTVEHQTPDQQEKNRRVELVLEPNVEEMLNLNNFGDDTAPSSTTSTTGTATPPATSAPPPPPPAPAPH